MASIIRRWNAQTRACRILERLTRLSLSRVSTRVARIARIAPCNEIDISNVIVDGNQQLHAATDLGQVLLRGHGSKIHASDLNTKPLVYVFYHSIRSPNAPLPERERATCGDDPFFSRPYTQRRICQKELRVVRQSAYAESRARLSEAPSERFVFLSVSRSSPLRFGRERVS